jgi:hypothetical protein
MPFRWTPWNDKQKYSWTSLFLHLNKPLALYEDTIESDIHREAEPLTKGCQNLHHPKNQKVTAAKTTFMLQQIMSHK